MPASGKTASASRSAVPLYVLLLSTLALAGVLGYQAYDSARSHRETAQKTLSFYAQLANWRYQDWAYSVIDASLTDVLAPLGRNYEVSSEDLWHPSKLLSPKRKPSCPCPPMPLLDYAFEIDRESGEMTVAGQSPAAETLDWIRDSVPKHADEVYEEGKDRLGVLFGEPSGRTEMFVYTIRANRAGAEHLYGFRLELEVLPGILAKTPLKMPLLPPSLTGDVPAESYLSVAIGMPPKHAKVVLGDSISYDYWAAESLSHPYSLISTFVGLDPEVAESLVIGGLPASRLPIVLGSFLLAAGLILAAAHQIRRENELARSRADFAMGVSHELRTPLTQIRMFLESVLLGRTVSKSQQRQYLEIAHEEAKRLSNLVDNVLRFSKVEQGTARIDMQALNLSESTRAIVSSWIPGQKADSMKIELGLAEDIPVLADPEALRAIVGNLLDNAQKYGPAEQTIHVGTASSNGMARLWVSDDGPGIPRDQRDRIWEPYQRLDRDAKSAVAGTGIGLSIVKEFVRLHGGKVWVEESETGGARFVVELEMRDGAALAST